MHMKTFLSIATTLLLLVAAVSTPAHAQQGDDKPLVVIFPFKNLDGVAKYDSLIWEFPRALAEYINQNPTAGTAFDLITIDDMLDQMLALNVEVNPHAVNYETDVFDIAQRLDADLIIFGSYKVKYEKVNFAVKVFDINTMLPDENSAERIIIPYDDALSVVQKVGDKILPAFGGEVTTASE